MEDQIKDKNSEIKKIIILIAVIVVLSILFFMFEQIKPAYTPNTVSSEILLGQSECQEKINKWCNDCFFANNQKTDVWNIGGTKIGEILAKCSVNYFQTDWTAEQDCTGNAIDCCLPQIDLPIE